MKKITILLVGILAMLVLIQRVQAILVFMGCNCIGGNYWTRPSISTICGSGTINILDARLLINYITNPAGYPLNCACEEVQS